MQVWIVRTLVASAALALLGPQQASASHDTPLYQAARRYREASRDFQHGVNRARQLDHFARWMADRLGDTADRLVASARHLDHREHRERMLGEWNQIQFLQPRVEAVIFANPGCPSRGDLLPRWRQVNCAYDDLASWIAPICALPIAGEPATYGAYRSQPNARVPVVPPTPHRQADGRVLARPDFPEGRITADTRWEHRLPGHRPVSRDLRRPPGPDVGVHRSPLRIGPSRLDAAQIGALISRLID